MKQTDQCPKCGSRNINEPLTGSRGILVKPFRIAEIEYYVCRDCGFVERYLTKKGHKTFDKYGPPKNRGSRKCVNCGASVQPHLEICDRCGSVMK